MIKLYTPIYSSVHQTSNENINTLHVQAYTRGRSEIGL